MEWFLHFLTLWKNWAKEKNNKETQNVEVFLCPFSSDIKCYHSSWSRTEVHAHCTIQWMRWLIFNWLLNIWTVDNVFPMCSLSLSLSISFCLFSVFGSVLYSEKFPSILHHSSAEASIFLLGGWKMLLSLVHMQSSVYTKSIQIVENFLQCFHICFIFWGWQN